MNKPSELFQVVLAFIAIYIIWGSTYLAIAYAIETMPPIFMAGSRFFLAGIILLLIAFLNGSKLPTGENWKASFISGIFLLVGGNLSVVWAEQYIPSSIAAIVVATVPIWMVMMDRSQWADLFKNIYLILGLIVGFLGVIFLIGFDTSITDHHPEKGLLGFSLIILATISWAWGTIYSKRPTHHNNTLVKSGLQMFTAGGVMLLLSLVTGDAFDFSISKVSWQSGTAFIYLIIFGTIIGYSAFVWLVKIRPPALVGTYAYVNPIVAVFLGWLMRDEPITLQTYISLLIILVGVFMVNYSYFLNKKRGK